jgi:pyruvate dehydrogenase E2 component (dihydrolipoamide acetyltransferase)
MAEVIRMPKMSDTMEEGVIAAWNVKVGDVVKSGDILAEVETDKATMDMESYYDGTILYIGVEKGQAVPIDAVIAVIGAPGEEYQALLNGGSSPATATAAAEVAPVVEAPANAAVAGIDTSSIKATVVQMPLLSDTMTEGVIHKWLKKVGDSIKSGDMLAEIETDKATMEIEAYEDGTLLYIGVKEGEAALVNSVIAVIGEEGADFETLIKAQSAPKATASAPAPEAPKVATAPSVATPAPAASLVSAPIVENQNSDGRILASPLAKSLAKEKGINIGDVKGSGEGGRIVKADVDGYVPSAKPQAAASNATSVSAVSGVESFEETGLTQMRKAIARSLADSQSTAVDFSLTMEINMDKSIEARGIMNESSPVKISFNDMVLKACGL